jgi:hypothetical protein
MYGMNSFTRKFTKEKIRNTRFYMDNHYFKFGDEYMPYSSFFKNAFINPDRYVAEVQNRVWSIYNYARSRDLVNVFCTISAPSEHHPLRQIFKNGTATGKVVKNKNYNKENTPKTTAKFLTKQFQKILNDRIFRNIPKADRCYFRVIEPHKDGTPHLHISIFIPKDSVPHFTKLFNRLFPSPLGKLEVNINNPVAYLMKYVLKTLDDLRFDNDNISDLTLWYIYHGICRIYTSRTLISLDVYRVLGGRFSLNELTLMYKEKRLTVYVDPITNKPSQIFDDYGNIWTKKLPIDINFNHMRQEAKPCLREKKHKFLVSCDGIEYQYSNGKLYNLENLPKIPSKMKDLQLYEYYKTLDIETVNMQHYGLVQNECVSRGLIDGEIAPLDSFGADFEHFEKPLNPYENEFNRFRHYFDDIGA